MRRDYLTSFEPRVRRWLATPDPGPEDSEAADQFFERWLLGRMADGQVLEVGGVMVDRALLEVRFRCVPGRCSPAVERGKLRSCCADLTVYVTPAERGRLRRHARALTEHLLAREPRLRALARREPEFFLDPDGESLSRPGQRCVCSRLLPDGKIRCHLHDLAARLGVGRTDLQPVTCRLFPLVLVAMPKGGVLVTVNDGGNYRAWGARHPRSFPCLNDTRLPRVIDSMADTLDWLFGPGFAEAVRQAGAAGQG
ncbi:MAG TPA: hypothetical protein P5076_19075 [Myxococcota bacterium]|nr:hypothetical protein [Myxococcota bacterium]